MKHAEFENSANNHLTSDEKFRYSYDDEGNRVRKVSLATGESAKYVWDHRNRLVQVKTPKEDVNYVYDFRNRLVKRNDEFFVHDEWQIVTSLKNNKVTHRYLWGANQDELLATDDAWTLGDHLNSVRDIVDATGKVVAHREYNAFGKVTKSTGKFECIFGYTGKLFDNQTKLQWNINRWYDAEVGRWISEDPIGFSGRDVNQARYVHNIPCILRDYLGLETSSPCTDDLGANETCKEITRPAKEQEQTRTYIGDMWWYSAWDYIKHYTSAKWVSEGSAVTSGCGESLDANISTFKGTEHSISIGPLVNVGTEFIEISGTYTFSSSTGQTWTQNFSKPAKHCHYYKGYLARLKVTIEIWDKGGWVNTYSPGGSVYIPPGYRIDKTLYTNTGIYVCECCCTD